MFPGARRTRGEAANVGGGAVRKIETSGTPNISTRQRRVPITFSKGGRGRFRRSQSARNARVIRRLDHGPAKLRRLRASRRRVQVCRVYSGGTSPTAASP